MSGALSNPLEGLDTASLQTIGLYALPLVIVQWLQWRSGELQFMRLPIIPGWLKPVLYAGMFYAAVFLGGTPQSFVYFQF